MAVVLRDEQIYEVDALARPGTLLLAPASFTEATGWEHKSEGLCRGAVCVPTKTRPDLVVAGRIDLRVAADVLQRPLAIDDPTGVAVLGESAAARADEIGRGVLPDIELHDLRGNPFRWSRLGRKKKVLVAWASW